MAAKKEEKVVLELGSFISQTDAHQLLNKAEKIGVHAEIPCKVAGKYKVRTIPMLKADAEAAIKKLAEKKITATII